MARRLPDPAPVSESPVLTLRQACAYLQRGESWVRAHKEQIGVIRDGGKLLFLREDLNLWLARHRVQRPALAPVTKEPTPMRRAPATHRHARNPVSGRAWEGR